MKEKKHLKYRTPRVVPALLEAEGLLCQSEPVRVQVDALNNANATMEADEQPMYFDF